MKTFKTITYILTAASVLLCAANSKAATIVGTITDFSKVTVALTVNTEGAPVVKGSTSKQAVVSQKINNASLIALFASWTTNNPADWKTAGAQLEINWSNPDSYGLVVADKTGTNVLFYADSLNGINNGNITAFCDIRFFDNFGPFNETDTPASTSFTQVYAGDFELFYNNTLDGSQKIDLFSDGPVSEKYSQTTKPSWSENLSMSINNSGVTYNGTTDFVQVVGTITSTGKGNDVNPYLDLGF